MPFLRADEAPTQAEREKMSKRVFGDPENRKYPLDTDEHVAAAGSYLEKERNAGGLSDAKYREILTRVNAAKKARGIGQAEKSDQLDQSEHADAASPHIVVHHISGRPPVVTEHKTKKEAVDRAKGMRAAGNAAYVFSKSDYEKYGDKTWEHPASSAAREASQRATEATDRSGPAGHVYGKGQQPPFHPGSTVVMTPLLLHKAAGEAHLEAAKAHEAAAAARSGEPAKVAYHQGEASEHKANAAEHASAAGGDWDEAKHPRDENGKFDAADATVDRFERDVSRFDLSSGEIGERRRTPQGGLIAPSNLTRTGVFEYRMPDGSRRRELRSPDEVFAPASLATYPIAPVTVDHPGRVGPSNWKTHAVGTVGGGVRRNGDFVSGDLHIQHGDAMDRAESGELREISCGYTCDIDPTPGTFQGQPYDVSQRKIRMNHVALGPRGWGRMGADTKMHLDSATAVSGEAGDTLEGGPGEGRYLRTDQSNRPRSGENKKMATPEEKAAQEKADADAQAAKLAGDLDKAQKDVEQAREDAKTAKTAGEKLAAQAREDSAKIATLTAENELLKHQVERSRSDGKTAEQKRQAELKQQADVEEIVALRADARLVFSSVEDPTGANWKADGKNADSIRREIIMHLEPSVKLDSVVDPSGIYDIAIAHERRAQKARAEQAAIATGARRSDDAGEMGDDEDEPNAETARKGMIKRKKDAWKQPKKDRRPGMQASK